MASTLT